MRSSSRSASAHWPIRLGCGSSIYLRTDEEASVREIAAAVGGSQQNVSKHLSALRAEGFVARRKQGTSVIYRISDPGVHQICDGISAGIEAQLAEVGAALSG